MTNSSEVKCRNHQVIYPVVFDAAAGSLFRRDIQEVLNQFCNIYCKLACQHVLKPDQTKNRLLQETKKIQAKLGNDEDTAN
jgi:hypothetical protein